MISVEIQPDVTTWVPNPGGQATFCADWTHPFCANEGGWGSGKSVGGAYKSISLHCYNAFDAQGVPTRVMGAAVGPTLTGCKDYMIPHLQAACEDAGLSVEVRVAGKERDMAILFKGPERYAFAPILVRSADRPDRITGWEVGWAWADEATRWKANKHNPRQNAYLQLVGRVRDHRARFRQLNVTYTNEGDDTYVYNEFHSGKVGHSVYRTPTSENPCMKEFYEAQRIYLTAELAAQYLEGEAINYSGGRVYSQFDAVDHVEDGLEPRPDLPLHLSLDFNIAPGMHALIGQYWEDEDVFVTFHEIFEPRLSVLGVIPLLTRWIEDGGGFVWPEMHVFGDATGGSAWAATGETSYEILKGALTSAEIKYKLRVPTKNPPVIDRVNAFNVALLDIEENIHWVCSPQCERLIADLKDLKRGSDGEIDKSEHRLSHSSDAEGYRVHRLRPAKVKKPKDKKAGRVSV